MMFNNGRIHRDVLQDPSRCATDADLDSNDIIVQETRDASSFPCSAGSTSSEGRSNESRSNSGSEESDEGDWTMPDYVRMALLNTEGTRVLMRKEGESWVLPHFKYRCHGHFQADRCCRDFQEALGIRATDKTIFTVVVELLGYCASKGLKPEHQVGFGCLLLLEAHVVDIQLPSDFAWQDAEKLELFHEHLKEANRHDDSLKHILTLMGPKRQEFLARFVDPRYRYGWFSQAANWMRSVVTGEGASPIGRVIQVQVTPTSTILKLNSTKGWFYAKSPALGSNEASITAAVGSLFPQRCVQAVDVCNKSRCFITRGFDEVDIEYDDLSLVIRTLGNLQLDCMDHVEELLSAGCPDHTPARLAVVLREWAKSETLKGIFLKQFFQFEEALPHLETLCDRLRESEIPVTLVHGDYEERNMTFSDESKTELKLFDWQYACISHPFCDMHGLDDEFRDMDEQPPILEIVNYRRMFSKYCADDDKLREDYDAGQVIGKILMMWTALECLEACDVHEKSALGEMVYNSFREAVAKMRRIGFFGGLQLAITVS